MLDGREREVAAVSERLKAFLADSRRAGPRYLEGAEPLPDGGIVLRLAQGKIRADDELVRRAAQEFVRRVCLFESANHYQVLCAARDASPETIKENYHLLMSLLHPDRQEGAEQAWPRECAQRVNLAYAALGDAHARREYDLRLRSERPRAHLHRAAPSSPRRRMSEIRFAKALIVVSVVVAMLVGVGLMVHDDEWSDRSVLEASFARLRTHSASASQPRYVGAGAFTRPRRANDAITTDEPETFEFLKPLVRAIAGEEPKAFAPAPSIEAVAAPQAPAQPRAAAAPEPVASLQRVVSSERPPVMLAQNEPAPRAVPVDVARPSNKEVEGLVVSLIAYYEAGDAERLVGLVDGGFWSNNQARNAYSEFFRATKSRRLRVERLAWNASDETLKARGEATVQAEYFDRVAPFERRVGVEMDIVLRDGKARLTRLSLFPDAR